MDNRRAKEGGHGFVTIQLTDCRGRYKYLRA